MAEKYETRNVMGYTVYLSQVIGQGAYGIIYKAKDKKGSKIAAKHIYTIRKHSLSNIIHDIQNLKKLNHPNIIKVYDIHQEENVIWIFMELCEHGDLNNFYRKTILKQQQLITIMSQIAAGVAYLHENNIVHRDIKPENILVAKNSPIEVKLTDFDVSKFFEEVFDTSAMSTNVGTLAFKAPEFFRKNPEGKLRYHRNVDCYAMGLTFLALLQANTQTIILKPQIETPQDDSEYSQAIGQLIAERIKYKIKQRDIVVLEKLKPDATSAMRQAYDVKQLIQRMTFVEPEQRITAGDVFESLTAIELSRADDRINMVCIKAQIIYLISHLLHFTL